ncbi:hypothetical protein CCM_08343 [Cordyceps militaris CM01]|uniref:Uncharacterized protein n=1 Tax=Cordyceps militaris (strain CM01) TaxID=983644 RepID=G3JTF3_CORMM|nr:uncharacterized protein CCM_08343 [Cordyceps militaris CM01]EGX88300.1 hypothetical protein CCM_08343 [Cordyceps militaris CM01]
MKLRPRKPVNYAPAPTDSASGSPAQPSAGGGVGDAPGPDAQPPAGVGAGDAPGPDAQPPAGVGVGDAPGPDAQPPAGVGVGDAPGPERQHIIPDWIGDTSAPDDSLPVVPSTPEKLTAGMTSLAISGAEWRERTESNYSSNPDPEWDDPEKNRAVQDEQIVNTALILLLNVLTLTFNEAQGKWSLYRQPFCVRDRNAEKVFEARVDGTYTVGGDNVSIVEVKPYNRNDSIKVNSAVSMQETAQMAAWISQFPPADARTAPPERMYRRLLLSQDKDEVFCTVASFRPAYVRYICDWTDTTQEDEDIKNDEGFLKMDQQGPFMVARDKHMELLGKLLLAYVIQGSLEEEI